MPADWYIVKPDKELGPYTGAQMKQLAASGQLSPNQLLRRADRSEPIRAAQVRGMFGETSNAAESPVSTPPPLPSEVRSAKPTGSSEPPPLPGVGSSQTSLHERIEVVKEATRGAARLASAEARRAHLKMVALPAAYLALGRDVAQGGRFRTEFPEIYGEIDRIRAELARLTTGEKEKPGATLSDKARQAAKAVTDTVQAKALGLRLRAAQQKLGEAVHPVHGAESAEPTLVQPIDDALTELATIETKLAQEEESQRGRLVTPRRLLYATAGTIVLMVCVLASSRTKQHDIGVTPPPNAASASGLASVESGQDINRLPEGRIVYVRGGDIDLFIRKLDDICAHEPGCGGQFPSGLNLRKDTFLRFFGEPDSDVGASGNERFWRYRCRDGLLVLTVADLGSNLLVNDYSWIQRENLVAAGLSRQEMLKLLASQVGEDRTQALGDRRAIEKVPIDGTWWFDNLGKPTVLQSLNDRGRKQYAYRCSDGVIGFEVQEYYRPDFGIRAIAIESVDLP